MAYLQRLQPTLDGVKKTAGRGLVVLGAGAVLSSLAMAAARWQASRADKRLPEEFVIEIDLTDLKLVETMPTNPLELLQGAPGKQLELRKVVHALEVAGKDPRVRGVLAKLGSRDRLGGMATIQELRSAIQSYRTLADARGGAPAVAFSAAFGEAGSNGTMEYYLASGFDKVYMQSSGSLGLLGLQSQMLFFKDLLDRLKVKPIVYTREKFKTALHMFTQEGFTPEHKENVQSILKSLTNQMWSGIASSRGLTLDQVQSAVRAAPLMPDAALSRPIGAEGQQPQGYGLIDGIKYIDQVVSGLVKSPKLLSIERSKASKGSKGEDDLVDPKLPRIPISKYILVKDLVEAAGVAPAGGWLGDTPWAGLWPGAWATASQNKDGFAPGAKRTSESAGWVSPSVGRGRPKLAIITATGAIVQGPVGPGGPPGRKMIDATKLAAQLNRLAEARDVKAVVLRVSSPGGSALGSDTLHHALMNLKESGKTLVVSLGDVAASGGMFMAVAGDRIIAQPGTITGSIGVVVGKPDASGLLTENGVNPESIEEGSPNLTLLSPLHGINQDQEVTINAMMDHIYDDFLQKVATGRHMSVEAVRGLAGGRVYTGEQALEVGLVDELGGLKDALEAAKKLAGLPTEEGKVVVFDYPPRKVSFLVRLLQSMGPSLTPEQLGEGAGAWAAGAGAAHHPLLALMEGVVTSAQVRRVLGAVGEVVQTAGELDGVVSVYAADAQLLAETLA